MEIKHLLISRKRPLGEVTEDWTDTLEKTFIERWSCFAYVLKILVHFAGCQKEKKEN